MYIYTKYMHIICIYNIYIYIFISLCFELAAGRQIGMLAPQVETSPDL